MRKKKLSLIARILRIFIEKWKKLVPVVLGFLGIMGGILGFRDDIGDLLEFLNILYIPPANNCFFTGSVVDERGKPLPGVQLNVEGNRGADSTDSSGNFNFKVTAPTGTRIRLTCTKPGFQTYDDYFILPGPTKILLRRER